MRPLLVLVCLLVCSPARAQQGQLDEATDSSKQVEWVERTADRFGDAGSDQGELALTLWAWRLERGERARALIAEAMDDCYGDTRSLLEALLEPPPLPVLVTEERLDLLLVAPPGETVLERCVRSIRFTRGLDRAAMPTALDALDARHPWVEDVRARWGRAGPILPGLVAMFDALALPDPRTAERVRLGPEGGGWRDDPWAPLEGMASRGWVLDRDTHAVVLDDRLRCRRVSLSRAVRTDVDEELRQWAIPGDEVGHHLYGSLDIRDCGAMALRGWWALRRGQAWTAARIVDQAPLPERADARARLGRFAMEVVRAVQQACYVDLGGSCPRVDIVASLRGASRVMDLAGVPADEYDAEEWREVRAEVDDLADRLEAQDAALRAAPHALVQLQNALVDHPDAAARIVIRAER